MVSDKIGTFVAFSLSGISTRRLDRESCPTIGRGNPPRPRLPRHTARSCVGLGALRVPSDCERIDSHRPEERHPISRATRQAAYQMLSDAHNIYKQYIPSAFEVALAVLK